MADDINIDEIQSRLDELASALNSAASSLSSSLDGAAKSSKKSAQAEDQSTAATNQSTKSLNENTSAVDKRTEAEEEAAKKIAKSNAAYSKAIGSLQQFGSNLRNSATGVDKGFAKYGSGLTNVGDAAVALGDQFGIVGGAIGRAVSAITVFATAGLEINQAISDTRVQLNKFAGVLPITQAQLGEMAAAAQFSGTDIKKFGDVLSGLGPNVLGLGGNTAEASVRFLEIANVSDDVRRQFSRMGVEQERLVELQGEYGALQSASGLQALQALKTDKQIQKESLKYAESLTTISEITGLTAEQQRAEAEVVQRDLREKLQTQQEIAKVQRLEAQGRQEEADALRAEIEKRKDAQGQLANILGPDLAIQISQSLRTGAIDPTNSALAQLGISAGELTRIQEESADGQEAAGKIQDLVFEKLGSRMEDFGGSLQFMDESTLRSLGFTQELIDKFAAFGNRQESTSEQITAAEERRQKKLQEATDKQVDNQAELSLAEAAFRQEFNAIATEIGAKILPIFTKLYGVIQPVIRVVGDILTPVFDVLVSVLNPVIDLLGVVFDILEFAFTPIIKVLGTVFSGLSIVIEALLSPITALKESTAGLSEGFRKSYDDFEKFLLEPIENLGQGIKNFYSETWADLVESFGWLEDPIESVTSAFESLFEWFSNLSFSDILPDIKLPSWLGGGGDDDKKEDKKEDEGPGFFSSLGDTLSGAGGAAFDALSGVGGTITDSLSGIGGTVTDVLGTAFEVATTPHRLAFEGLQSVAGTVIDSFSGIDGSITDSLSGIGGTVTDVLGTAFDVATTPHRLAFEGLQTVAGTVIDSFSGIDGTIIDSLSGLGGTVTDVLGTAFEVATTPHRLAFEGLQTVAGTVTDAFSGIGGTISDTMGSAFDTVTAPIVSVFDTLKDVAGSIGGIVSEKLKESFDLMYDIYDSIRIGLAGEFDTSTVLGRRELLEQGTDEDWSKLAVFNEQKERNEQSGGNLYESEDALKRDVLNSIYGVAIDAGTSLTSGSEINEETGEQKRFKSIETWTDSIDALGEVARLATKSGYDQRLVSGDNPDGEIYEKDFSTRTQSRDEIIETKDYFREGARAVGDWFRELDSSVKMLVDSSPLDGPIPNATDKLVDDVVQQTEASTVATTDTAPTEQSKDTSLLEQLVQSQQMMINSLGSKLDSVVSALDDGNDTQAKILRNTY